jgi:flavin-dependent dehydrogenase
LGIHWSIPILEKLLPADLSSRLFEAQCDPGLITDLDTTIELLNSETGDVLKTISTPDLKRVSRKKLRALCAEGIEVLWGKTLGGITYESDEDCEGLTAHFTNGSTYYGNMLVGADGPKSKVRELLLGAEKAKSTPLDIIYNMSIVKYGDAKKALHVLQSGHPQNSFGYNPKGIFSFLAGMLLTSTL